MQKTSRDVPETGRIAQRHANAPRARAGGAATFSSRTPSSAAEAAYEETAAEAAYEETAGSAGGAKVARKNHAARAPACAGGAPRGEQRLSAPRTKNRRRVLCRDKIFSMS
jgi:hypothetical protein